MVASILQPDVTPHWNATWLCYSQATSQKILMHFIYKLSHYKASSDCTTSCRLSNSVCLPIAGDHRLSYIITAIFLLYLMAWIFNFFNRNSWALSIGSFHAIPFSMPRLTEFSFSWVFDPSLGNSSFFSVHTIKITSTYLHLGFQFPCEHIEASLRLSQYCKQSSSICSSPGFFTCDQNWRSARCHVGYGYLFLAENPLYYVVLSFTPP